MDNEIITETLNSTLQRHARTVQNYEIEVANMSAEIFSLKRIIAQLEKSAGNTEETKEPVKSSAK